MTEMYVKPAVTRTIAYSGGYKYQLKETATALVPELAGAINVNNYTTDFIQIWKDGTVVLRRGFAWDGPSGPTIDTDNFMRGSVFHDAVYQLIRNNIIEAKWKDPADCMLRRMCLEDEMSSFRAWVVYNGVYYAAGGAIKPENKKTVWVSPTVVI